MRGTPEEKRRAEARLQRKHRAVREDATDGERQHRERLSARDELREAEARLRRENEDRQVLQREETRREGADTVSGRGGRRMRELRTDDARVKRGRRERDVTRGGDTDAIEKMTKAAERKAEARVQDFFTRKVATNHAQRTSTRVPLPHSCAIRSVSANPHPRIPLSFSPFASVASPTTHDTRTGGRFAATLPQRAAGVGIPGPVPQDGSLHCLGLAQWLAESSARRWWAARGGLANGRTTSHAKGD